ncbi:hypothetical protein CBR_g49181 [Chara braunii]|uniref:Uncharacterized protein n=1 Tax=Chara braunii TaxID=69332 RepID=A0A388M476_CHABU|nr:hypothetical protein CBR_g49181 [Chara braunii]|eukprot:GBG89390.1 hypothetical protein CBR_g49181 [Chara braunii]
MPYEEQVSKVEAPVRNADGLEMTVPKGRSGAELSESWWGSSLGSEAFMWVETSWNVREEWRGVRVTIYLAAILWRDYESNFDQGLEDYLLLLTGMAEVRLRVWEREGPWIDTREVMKEIKMLPAKDFTLPVRYVRTTLPDFMVEEVFFGQERLEMVTKAALRVPNRGYDFFTPHMIYYLYLEMDSELTNSDFSNILSIVNAYARVYFMEERFGYWEKLKEEVRSGIYMDDIPIMFGLVYNFWSEDWVTVEEMEEEERVYILKGYEAMELTRGGAPGKKTSWETIKRNLASDDLDQVFHHQVKMEKRKRKEVSAIQGADLALGGVLSSMAAQLKEMKEQMAPGKVMAVGQATNKKRYGEEDEGDKEEEEEEPEQTTKAKTTQKKIKNQSTGKQGTGKGQNPQHAGTSEAQTPATHLTPWPVVAPMGNKNRADGLSRIEWEKPEEAKEETPPVDRFLEEDDMQLHVNAWALRVEDDGVREERLMWFATTTFVKDERLNPVKGATMTWKGGVAGPSRSASGKERRQGLRRLTRDADGMPIYKKGDNLRLFLREFEDYAFKREWDTPTMLMKVNGVGECQLKVEEITTDCLGWMTFKTEMWVEYGDLRRDEIEDDIIFDGTNVENFEDSLPLCAEKKGWKEEEKLEQVMARVDPREYESMRKIKEESDTWGGFLVKFRRTYTLAVLDKKRTTIQKGDGSARRTARVQEKRRGRKKKQSKEEEEGEREHDMMREEEGKKEVEGVARAKEGTKEKKEREEEGEKGSNMMSGKEGKKEVEEVSEEKRGAKENEEKEEERNQTEKQTEMTAFENPLREQGSKRMTKEEREKREEENKEWRNRMVASMKEGELSADAPWSEKIERILLIESIRGSKLRSDLDKLIRLHELLRDDCEWLLERGAEIVEKLEGAGRSQRGNDKDGKMEASMREFQERVKEKEKLFTQGVASHIPEILKEIQRLRKKEEGRDAQVEKIGKEVESMRA